MLKSFWTLPLVSYLWQNNNGNLSNVFISALVFLVTSAEREVRDSGRSGIDLFWQDWAREVRRIFGFSGFLRSESRISSRYLEITSTSLIYSLTYSSEKELPFWLARGLNRLTRATPQIRGDSKLRD